MVPFSGIIAHIWRSTCPLSELETQNKKERSKAN
jgi:hypothetical protein